MSSVEAMRRFRAKPENRQREQKVNSCRAAALVTLANLHRDEYEALCNQERRKAGLPPLGDRTGRRPIVRNIRTSKKAATASKRRAS